MRDFKKLKIWQKGIDIARLAFKVTEFFPPKERFGLCAQITRAAVSIASNIAEGSGRCSEKEYSRFIEIALGSSFELETQIIIAKMANLAPQEELNSLLALLDEEQKMLYSFINKLKKGKPNSKLMAHS